MFPFWFTPWFPIWFPLSYPQIVCFKCVNFQSGLPSDAGLLSTLRANRATTDKITPGRLNSQSSTGSDGSLAGKMINMILTKLNIISWILVGQLSRFKEQKTAFPKHSVKKQNVPESQEITNNKRDKVLEFSSNSENENDNDEIPSLDNSNNFNENMANDDAEDVQEQK